MTRYGSLNVEDNAMGNTSLIKAIDFTFNLSIIIMLINSDEKVIYWLPAAAAAAMSSSSTLYFQGYENHVLFKKKYKSTGIVV